MISLDQLACLDTLLWLRREKEVARRLSLHQSTVCRTVQRALEIFSLEAKRSEKEWHLVGDTTLLDLERRVHQFHRWNHGGSLRLEAQYWSGPLLCDPAPAGWSQGNYDYLEVSTPFAFLRSGVIDAWLGCAPDCAPEDDPDIASIRLDRMPTHLIAADDHPLHRLGDAITLADVIAYPSLALPDGAFPKVQEALTAIGLWNTPYRLKRYRKDLWEDLTEDQLVVGYATVFTRHLFGLSQSFLPLPIPLEVGDTLMVRREYADHPRFLALKEQLLERLRPLAGQYPEVVLLDGATADRQQDPPAGS